MIVCTSLCANYLPKALALAESLRRHQRGARLLFCLVEKEYPDAMPAGGEIHWVLARRLGWKNFGRAISSHNRMEGATLVKARLMRCAFRRFPGERYAVYLDPDTLVLAPLRDLETLLARRPIVLTPHLLQPGNREMELSCLNHGVFNLGFLGLRRSTESSRFLAWWAERLDEACYDDRPNGLFTDQKWVDLAPAFFDVQLLCDPAYNVATWALKERKLTRRGGRLYANGKPVRFVHFSGFDQRTYFWAVDRWAAGDKKIARELGEAYARRLAAHGQATWGRAVWSYDYLDNGEKLPAFIRRALKHSAWLAAEDPYCLSVQQIKRRLLPEQRLAGRLSRLANKAYQRARDVLNGKTV